MKIGEILKKVAAGDELSDDEKSFLESYEEPNLDAVANAKGKKERLKLEAKVAEAEAKAAEALEALEDAGTSSSEMEKLQKQMEKLTAKITDSQTALEAEKSAHATTQRSNALKSVNVPWLESVPQAYRDTVLGDAFKDIDTDDLKDGDVLKPIVANIIESQASFVASSVTSGTGAATGEKASVSTGNKLTVDNVLDLKGQDLIDNMSEAFAVANQAS